MQNISKINHLLIYLSLILFSFFVNFYYANLGIEPVDSFVLYNGGFKVSKNLIPFYDYWLVTGPLMDYLNAFFFKIFGVSWRSYVIHSSFTNALISTLILILFFQLKLGKFFSLFYALMFSILMYPSVGVPFVDHHATIFVLASFCFFILGINNKNNRYFFVIPFFLILGFLCKQTPTTYGVLAIFFLGLINLYKHNDVKSYLYNIILGSALSIIFLLSFFYIANIPISNFLTQYILFASSIGDYRLSNWQFDISGFIHQFKFVLLPLLYLFYLAFLKFKKKNKSQLIILLSIIFFTVLMLFHQSLTMNENYIFFVIPILTAFIHIFNENNLNKKNLILYFIIGLCIFSVTKYHLRYNENRKFHRLEKTDFSKAVDASAIHKQLKGLKWITNHYQNDPRTEIENINESLQILRKEKGRFSIITDYLFIPAVLNVNDMSPNQWYHPTVSFPLKDQKYYEDYKTFFIKKLEKNKIKKILIVGNGLEDLLFATFDKSCFKKSQLGKITFRLELKDSCKEFK
tara:strand:+ start:6145 stop:7698 length:1554 start_codon:yes stop_codon:yes gene_type:complete